MSVISKIKNFYNRNRNKFIISGIVIGGSIILFNYIRYKFDKWQETKMLEFLELRRKQQHFDNITITCNQTINTLCNTLLITNNNLMQTEKLIEDIHGNSKVKVHLWEKLKVKIFTKATCLIYVTVMLVIVLKIQLSIIGGYLYKDSNSISVEIQEKYLSMTQHLLNDGLKQLKDLIEKKYEEILEPIPLTKLLQTTDLDAIFWSIQTSLATDNNSPIEKLSHYVIYESFDTKGINETMMQDTFELLNSDEVKSILTHGISRGCILLRENIFSSNTSQLTNGPDDVKRHLAKILPIIDGKIKSDFQQQFLQQLLNNDKIIALSANVYESFL